MNILIVDDHAVVRKGLKQIIAEEYPDATIAEAADTETIRLHTQQGRAASIA